MNKPTLQKRKLKSVYLLPEQRERFNRVAQRFAKVPEQKRRETLVDALLHCPTAAYFGENANKQLACLKGFSTYYNRLLATRDLAPAGVVVIKRDDKIWWIEFDKKLTDKVAAVASTYGGKLDVTEQPELSDAQIWRVAIAALFPKAFPGNPLVTQEAVLHNKFSTYFHDAEFAELQSVARRFAFGKVSDRMAILRTALARLDELPEIHHDIPEAHLPRLVAKTLAPDSIESSEVLLVRGGARASSLGGIAMREKRKAAKAAAKR